MKPIVTFPKGSITVKDKVAICKAGYLPIETDAQLQILYPSELISGNDMARCAISAIRRGNDSATMRNFVVLLDMVVNPEPQSPK